MSAPIRLGLTALAIVTPIAVLAAAFVGWQVSALLTERTAESLSRELRTLRTELDRGGEPALATLIDSRSADPGPFLYRLQNTDGARRAGNLQHLPQNLSNVPGIFTYSASHKGGEHTAAGLIVPLPAGGTMLVAHQIDDQIAFARSLQRYSFVGISALTVLALALGWLSTRRFVQRVAGVTATARSIMAGDLSQRVPRDYSADELDELSGNLNAMLSRIEELMASLREVSDNIAHDLKTPLTRLRNRAEAALRDESEQTHREGLEKVIEEADGLIQTFNALLLIARLEAGAIDATRTDCDIAALVADVGELYQPVADDAGLSLIVEPSPPVPFSVNRQLVGQAIANLIDNAIKYASVTPASQSSPITVSLSEPSDDTIAIAVADRGPGIAGADRERATRRFVRLEQSRSRPGTGLGLSLVAAVARLHGGTLRLEDNAPGLRVTLLLRKAGAASQIAPTPGGSKIVSPSGNVACSADIGGAARL